MIAILVMLPLLLAAFLALFFKERPGIVKYAALLGSIASLAIAAYLLWSPPLLESVSWFTLGPLSANISTATMPINMIMLMLVSVITPLIFLYSFGFMRTPSEQSRFYFEMCVFAAAMMLFAISSSFITMFIAWEMLGITSYLLIGFWYKKEAPPAAARKAITTMLIGDMLMLIGIIIIGASYSTFEFSAVLAAPNYAALDTALLLILVAAFTKSAQFPFHEWLSDAMEGPTPVSAFLHSSTMVKAGVFLIIMLFPLYSAAGMLPIMLVIGLISAFIGMTNALTERHVKKILAYSTIEDLGLMFVALGLGAFYAAIVLFFVQTFYKALLFMSTGSIMRANEDKEDIQKLYGSTLSKPVFIAMLIGTLSIAGIFPLSGFFGKAAVESAAQNIIVYAIIMLIQLGTSLYIFRFMFIPMKKSYEQTGPITLNYKALPKSMIISSSILALLVLAAAFFYIYLPQYLNGGTAPASIITLPGAIVLSIVAIVGLAIAAWVYLLGHRMHLASTNRTLFFLAHSSWLFNAFYSYCASATAWIANLFAIGDLSLDKSTYGMGSATLGLGNLTRRLANGQVNLYLLFFVFGLILMILAFTFALW
jgi:NADH-quinone oxidoreductase subunit L